MAQYQHLPIYKQTYDLLVRVTEITRAIRATSSRSPARSASK